MNLTSLLNIWGCHCLEGFLISGVDLVVAFRMTDDTMTDVGRGWACTQLGLC